MATNRILMIIILAAVLIFTTAAGCQQLSKLIKPKSSSSSSGSSQSVTTNSVKSSSPALTEYKFVSLWCKVLYPVTTGTYDDIFFSMINCPITFNGLSFTGGSMSAKDWCNSQGGAKADCVKSFECKINGTVSQDKSKLETVNYDTKIIIDDKRSVSGKYEITGIPFKTESDFRKNKTGCLNNHRYYELRGETVSGHVVSIEMVRYAPGYILLAKPDFIWQGSAGFEFVFKLLDCNAN